MKNTKINSKSSTSKKVLDKLSIIERVKEVLRIEAQGVLNLVDKVDSSFERAVELLYECKGRIVVTGIGKPGIIGKKFSATLASTGTPSLWLHPVEAVHGDLGMIVAEDVVVGISNSGETEELVRFVPIIKKLGAKLISLTGNPKSTLASSSDICLDISVEKEACTLGLVPTTSTTVALAVTDALAVALLEKRGFEHKDYAFYHPGGSIGRKLLKIKDVMRTGRSCAVVQKDMLVKDVLGAITEAKAGSATVVDNKGKICGFFTDGDLRRSLISHTEILSLKVSEVMTHNPFTVGPEILVEEALHVIKEKKFDEVIVADENGLPIGIVDEKDLLGLG